MSSGKARDDDWVTLAGGEKIYLPKLPSQEAEDEMGIPAGSDPRSRDKGFQLLDKVRNAWGSTAGAGSDFFNVYRKQRAREIARQEQMDQEAAREAEAEEFQARRIGRIEQLVRKQNIKQAKRKRRKQTAQIKAAVRKRELASAAASNAKQIAENRPQSEEAVPLAEQTGESPNRPISSASVEGGLSLQSSALPATPSSILEAEEEEPEKPLFVIRDEEDNF